MAGGRRSLSEAQASDGGSPTETVEPGSSVLAVLIPLVVVLILAAVAWLAFRRR